MAASIIAAIPLHAAAWSCVIIGLHIQAVVSLFVNYMKLTSGA
jgi:hypothetical protein